MENRKCYLTPSPIITGMVPSRVIVGDN
jgi:hypothetical protein